MRKVGEKVQKIAFIEELQEKAGSDFKKGYEISISFKR